MRFGLVERQPSGNKPLFEPLPDLFCLVAAVTHGHEIVRVADQDRGCVPRTEVDGVTCAIPDPAAASIPCKATFSSSGLITPP